MMIKLIKRTMTQEEKQLLLKDLCTRLPYETAVECSIDSGESMDVVLQPSHIDEFRDELITIKPYLRLMSSMTESEKREYDHRLECMFYDTLYDDAFVIDWLNERHFDYRGLISKGLAIAVTEENSPYEN